jgi:hypothetical protein
MEFRLWIPDGASADGQGAQGAGGGRRVEHARAIRTWVGGSEGATRVMTRIVVWSHSMRAVGQAVRMAAKIEAR